MNDKSYIVFPLKRIAATIYDLFLLLGVWFAVGSIAVWLNGGVIEAKWIGPLLVFISTWTFYGYFWTHGGKTLGMAVWKFQIYSIEKNKINFQMISIRFFINIITFFLGGVPLFFMYFSKDNLSLSDYFSKTSYKKI
ncbi:MAG: RDD family protein [Gammaproteobacteria bacterium]